jgi:hypothetical protein
VASNEQDFAGRIRLHQLPIIEAAPYTRGRSGTAAKRGAIGSSNRKSVGGTRQRRRWGVDLFRPVSEFHKET